MTSSKYRRMQNFKIFWGFRPLDPTRALPRARWGLYSPPRPPGAKGNDLSCLWQTKTQLKISLQLPKGHKTVSVLICSLQNVFGQFTKPGHFFKSSRCKLGVPRRIFSYLTRKYLGGHWVCYRGVLVILFYCPPNC